MVDCRTLFDTLPGCRNTFRSEIRFTSICTTGNFEYCLESLIACIIAVRIELRV